MGYAFRSNRTSDNQAVITIRRDTVISTAAWSLATFDPEIPYTDPLLFSMTQSGVGVLSDSGKTLTITIPVCPMNDFRLTVGSLKKIFNLTDGKITPGAEVTVSSGLTWQKIFNGGQIQAQGLSGTTGPAIIFFNSTEPDSIGGNHRAKLYKGDKLRCFAFGTTFETIRGERDLGYAQPWFYTGILFYHFGWVGTPPEEPETLKMVLESGSRGGGTSTYDFDVVLSGTEAVGPLSDIFDVQAGDNFTLNDGFLR